MHSPVIQLLMLTLNKATDMRQVKILVRECAVNLRCGFTIYSKLEQRLIHGQRCQRAKFAKTAKLSTVGNWRKSVVGSVE